MYIIGVKIITKIKKTACGVFITQHMVNEAYDPSKNEEQILQLLKQGRVNPKLIKEKTELNDQQVNYALNQLIAAGWVRKVTTGLYELIEDPRQDSTQENHLE